jgi:tartrate dehydratase alpha subunit/fumarate hydratase class I-like protein
VAVIIRSAVQAVTVQAARRSKMLNRVVEREKTKYQLYLPNDVIREIRKASADENKTQSKFIVDLVKAYLSKT